MTVFLVNFLDDSLVDEIGKVTKTLKKNLNICFQVSMFHTSPALLI